MTLQILVAAAQPIAQKVIRAMLQRLDCQVDTVGSGSETLTSLQQQVYDIALLDLHLPDMSGLKIAHHVKQQTHLPCPWLIAMADQATESDLAVCLTSGMDDFLLKPLQLTQLSQALSQYEKSVLPVAIVSSPAINLDALYQFSQELVGTHKTEQVAFITELIETYASSTIQLVSSLQNQGADMDKKTIYRTAHTLKSASASIYAQQLVHACQCLEVAINQNNADVPDWIARVLREYEQVQLELNEELQNWGMQIQGWKIQLDSQVEAIA